MRAPTPLPTVEHGIDWSFALVLIAIWAASVGISLGVISFLWLHWDAIQTALWAWMTAIS